MHLDIHMLHQSDQPVIPAYIQTVQFILAAGKLLQLREVFNSLQARNLPPIHTDFKDLLPLFHTQAAVPIQVQLLCNILPEDFIREAGRIDRKVSIRIRLQQKNSVTPFPQS